MSAFRDAMRRVITGDDADGRSVVIIDGGPSSEIGLPDMGGLFEIWEDAASGPLDPKVHDDLGPNPPILGPKAGNVQVRWFVIAPTPEGVPKAERDEAVRTRFKDFGGEHHIIDQSRHSGMHETHSIDIICLLQGEASLILENDERRLKPGQVVIQRGTNHAWEAHGGPALLLAVLIDRPLARS
jgi:quercetin dioxygenase-like cupin family protein